MLNLTTIIKDDMGEQRKAHCPVIISASRATDIPAFYSEWLVNRIKLGYVKWKNPFSGEYSYVSFEKARLFVFWTKNPEQLMHKLQYFDDMGYNYYFQYTLNDYEAEKWEPHLPSLDKRIETFTKLSEKIGKEKVIWRFDPIIITEMLYPEKILERIKRIGDQIHGYTERMVFSFIDVDCYKKVKSNLALLSEEIREIAPTAINELAKGISDLNKKWDLELGTCAEILNMSKYGIEHNRCIDDRLIVKLFSEDAELMKYIGIDTDQITVESVLPQYSYSKIKDKGQRKACGCIQSKDIGQYDTCPHGCVYCYANSNPQKAMENYKKTGTASEMLL
ncbi:MAG: DUF1848 domain-containing protein [Candidatus Cloacimonetes bacterium]|nr:DUF1848 domain-containing protein [Candidatus Cloacimonadota bacterium]